MKKSDSSSQPSQPSQRKTDNKPRSKEEAIQQMAQRDPEKVAALLREILKNQ